MNEVILRPYKKNDNSEIREIFNYFGTESYACYNENDLSEEEIQNRMANTFTAFVYENAGKVIGFGYLSKYKDFNTFDHTGVLTYFLKPEFTHMGLGSKMLSKLFSEGKKLGVNNFVAHISSKNEASLNFHKKNGFEIIGNMKKMAYKYGEFIDIIWVQKIFEGGQNE